MVDGLDGIVPVYALYVGRKEHSFSFLLISVADSVKVDFIVLVPELFEVGSHVVHDLLPSDTVGSLRAKSVVNGINCIVVIIKVYLVDGQRKALPVVGLSLHNAAVVGVSHAALHAHLLIGAH